MSPSASRIALPPEELKSLPFSGSRGIVGHRCAVAPSAAKPSRARPGKPPSAALGARTSISGGGSMRSIGSQRSCRSRRSRASRSRRGRTSRTLVAGPGGDGVGSRLDDARQSVGLSLDESYTFPQVRRLREKGELPQHILQEAWFAIAHVQPSDGRLDQPQPLSWGGRGREHIAEEKAVGRKPSAPKLRIDGLAGAATCCLQGALRAFDVALLEAKHSDLSVCRKVVVGRGWRLAR